MLKPRPSANDMYTRGLTALASLIYTEAAGEYTGEDGIVRFVRNVLRVEPTPYQADVLRMLVRHKRVAVFAPHGVGKTALSAWVTLWAICAFQTDVKVVTTASAWRQVKHYTWPEIRLWASRMDTTALGMPPLRRGREILDTAINFGNRQAFAVASDNPALIEGAHASTLVYVFDEAKSIPVGVWDAAEGAFSNAGNEAGAEAYALAISTPGERSGRFYDICARKPGLEDWFVRHITLDEGIAAGRVSRTWAEQRRTLWGDSAVYQNRVLGEFADSSEENLIPLSWVDKAIERWRACEGKGDGSVFIGCDPAYKGEDQTAIATLCGSVLEGVELFSRQDTMQTANLVEARIRVRKAALTGVDVIGVGAGVFDRLKEMKMRVLAVNVAQKAAWANGKPMTDASGQLTFVNLRAALWWMLREALDPNGSVLLALPPDDRLIGDLTAPKWDYRSGGQIEVESKDSMRERIGRSPDSADALALALYAGQRAARKTMIML